MFCLIFLFELGSALLMGYGKDAGRGAWIVLLLGIVIGLLLYCIYTTLFYQFPTLPLTSYSQKILGKYVGWAIGFLYVLYFMYIAARFLYNFIDLLITSAYENTSPFIIGFFMMLSVIYVFNQGLEVIGRLAGISFCACYSNNSSDCSIRNSQQASINRKFASRSRVWMETNPITIIPTCYNGTIWRDGNIFNDTAIFGSFPSSKKDWNVCCCVERVILKLFVSPSHFYTWRQSFNTINLSFFINCFFNQHCRFYHTNGAARSYSSRYFRVFQNHCFLFLRDYRSC